MGGGGRAGSTDNVVCKRRHGLCGGEIRAEEEGVYVLGHTGKKLHLHKPLAASEVNIGRDGGKHGCQQVAWTLTLLQGGVDSIF